MVTRGALLAACLLACTGCSGPLLVPDAGPNAPGYGPRAAPPAPDVLVVDGPLDDAGVPGGAVDSVQVRDGAVVITGWALLPDAAPRGRLEVSLAPSSSGRVTGVDVVPRPDVVAATGRADLGFAGFVVTVAVSGTPTPRVCVQSSSSAGEHRLAGSSEDLCRTAR